MLTDYPKEFTLKKGQKVTVRPMVKADQDKLYEFFKNLPEKDRHVLKDDVSKKETIQHWANSLNFDRVLPIVAECEGKIVGDATLHRPLHGWQRHVGEIRVVVAKEYRRMGLATLLCREIFELALKAGLDKIVAEMMADQKEAIRVFQRLGFLKEAVLNQHVMDLLGKKHDLLVMTHHVSDLMEQLSELEEMVAPSRSMEH